ncbi:MAG: peptidylprolyl isomerase [Thermoleophilia bacterium]|nr:peptidylprolyl isomerase [Thermoleophilia bacterium]
MIARMSILTRHRVLPALLLVVLAALFAAGCGGDDSGSGSSSKSSGDDSSASSDSADTSGDSSSGGGGDAVDPKVAARADSYDAPPKLKLDPKKTYTVHMTTNLGAFDIAVDPKAGPIAAANFVFLVKAGYYDGTIFHRVIKDFMIQGGDPTGTGTGGPGYALKDDKVNDPYERGTVAMANAGPNTGGSQFFIVQGAQGEALPPQYVIFGKVDAAGMKVVDKIAGVEVTSDPSSGAPSYPVKPVRIESAKLTEG